MALTVGELVAYLRLNKAEFRQGLAQGRAEAKAGGQAIGDGLTRGIDGKLKDSRGKLVAAGTQAGEDFGEGFTVGADGRLRDSLGRFVPSGKEPGRRFGLQFSLGFTDEITSRADKVLAAASKAGRIGAAFGKAAALGLTAGLTVSGASNLVAALAPLAGLLVALPALAGAGGVAMGTLKLGMSGVADTLASGMAGDQAKYNEALAQLAPNAQDGVRALVGFKPAWDSLRRSVQDRLFAGVGDDIRAVGQVYLPELQAGLPKVAGSLSVFGENFAAAARRGALLGGVRAIIASTAVGLAHANDNVGGLTDALGQLLSVGAPLVERLGTGFASMSGTFAAFIERTTSSGQLAGWLQGAIDTAKTLGAVVGNVGGILSAVLGAANTAGGSLLTTLADLTGNALDFLQSVEGASALLAIFGAVSDFGDALGVALGAVLPALGSAFSAIGPQVGPLADSLAAVVVALAPLLPAAGELAAAIMPQLAQTIRDLTPAVSAAVAVVAVLAGWLSRYIGWVMPLVAGLAAAVAVIKVVALVTRLWAAAQVLLNIALTANPIGLIVLAVAALVGALVYAYTHSETFRRVVQAAWDAIVGAVGAAVRFFGTLPEFFSRLWGTVTLAFTVAVGAIGSALGAVVGFFAALPGRVLSALVALPGQILRFWVALLGAALFAVGYGVGTLVRFFLDLPGRVMVALVVLPRQMAAFWERVWTNAKALVSAGVAAVVSFLASLPGRASAAVSSLWGRMAVYFGTAKTNATAAISALVASAVSWLTGLPGKAAAALSAMPGRIKGAFSGAGTWLYQAGMDVLAGLARGITDAVGSVVETAKSAAGRVVGGFKSAMGISSPSRVMRTEVGRWIPPGIGEGIREGMPALFGQVGSLMGGMSAAVLPALRRAAKTVAAGNPLADMAKMALRGAGKLEEDFSFRGMPTGYRNGALADAFYASHPGFDFGPKGSQSVMADWLRKLATAPGRIGESAALGDLHVYIGDREITDMIDVQVDQRSRQTAGAATAGTGRVY